MSQALRLLVLLPVFGLAGCASIGITLAGLGAGVWANHYMNSITSRTFTEPLASVRRAALVALQRMAIAVEKTATTESGMLITAKAGGRAIEIELQPVTANATHMRSIARKADGFTLDSATAAEIIAQTEKALTQPKRPHAAQKAGAAQRTAPTGA